MKGMLTSLLGMMAVSMQWLIIWTLLGVTTVLVKVHEVTDHWAAILAVGGALWRLYIRTIDCCSLLGKRRWKRLCKAWHLLMRFGCPTHQHHAIVVEVIIIDRTAAIWSYVLRLDDTTRVLGGSQILPTIGVSHLDLDGGS